jgi:hypothetical protein
VDIDSATHWNVVANGDVDISGEFIVSVDLDLDFKFINFLHSVSYLIQY